MVTSVRLLVTFEAQVIDANWSSRRQFDKRAELAIGAE